MRRISFVIVVVAVLMALGIPAASYAAGSDATVSGVVSDSTGPIASATVQVDYLAKGGLPKRTAVITTASDGSWSYSGKAGDYRFTFSADGYYSHIEVLHTEAKLVYTLDMALSPIPPPMGTITGRISSSAGNGMNGYVYFFKQNADGTWPTGYLWQVATGYGGNYTSGPLPLGVYKVRLFTVHTGVQWYRYVSTIESATPITLDTADQVVSGIDAIFPAPAP